MAVPSSGRNGAQLQTTHKPLPPTREDWKRNRPVISSKYKEKTLKVVMREMLEEHGFKAT